MFTSIPVLMKDLVNDYQFQFSVEECGVLMLIQLLSTVSSCVLADDFILSW